MWKRMVHDSVLDAAETIRKLDSFGFLQWFGLVCSLMGGVVLGFIAGVFVSGV